MIGQLNRFQIDNFLRTEVIGRIGCSFKGQTYVVPVTYIYDGQYIYAHTREGLKVTMMRGNPVVCFEVDHVHNMANWQSVIVFGEYQEMKGKKAEEIVQSIASRVHPFSTSETAVPRHALDRPHARAGAEFDLVVFRIKINEVTGKFEKQ
jgi:hypothetical protein